MSLGEKLQRVNQKINTKLGKQDGTVIFRQESQDEPEQIGQDYASESHTDVEITAGIAISRVKSYETDTAGTIQVGDLKLKVPANLLTEEQLNATSLVIYGGENYSVVSATPDAILSGVSINWIVIARFKQ